MELGSGGSHQHPRLLPAVNQEAGVSCTGGRLPFPSASVRGERSRSVALGSWKAQAKEENLNVDAFRLAFGNQISSKKPYGWS